MPPPEYSLAPFQICTYNNDAIAAQLGFSPKTVRNYASNLFGKLQVADRAQAIIKAREAGMGR